MVLLVVDKMATLKTESVKTERSVALKESRQHFQAGVSYTYCVTSVAISGSYFTQTILGIVPTNLFFPTVLRRRQHSNTDRKKQDDASTIDPLGYSIGGTYSFTFFSNGLGN